MLKIPRSKKVASLDSHPGLSSLEHQPSHRRVLDAGVIFTSVLSTRCTMSALCDPASSGSPLEEAEPSTPRGSFPNISSCCSSAAGWSQQKQIPTPATRTCLWNFRQIAYPLQGTIPLDYKNEIKAFTVLLTRLLWGSNDNNGKQHDTVVRGLSATVKTPG